MGKIIRNGIEFSGACEDATAVNYNNSLSGLEAQTVQEAVDELNDSLETLPSLNGLCRVMTRINTTSISGYIYAFIPLANAHKKSIALHSVNRCWYATEYVSDWSIYTTSISPSGFYIRTTNTEYTNVEWIEVHFIVS